MDLTTTEPPKNSFYFEIEEYEIPEPEPFVPEEVPVAVEEEGKVDDEKPSDARDVEEVKPEPVPEVVQEPVANVTETQPKKKKQKVPLKPEIPLSTEELENVLSKLPETMQEALAAANEEGQYVFRGTGDVAAPPTRGTSVSRKIFPPPPPTEAELQAAKLAREQKAQQKEAIRTQTLAPVEKLNQPPNAPPGAPPGRAVAKDDKAAKKAEKAAAQNAKDAQKAAKEHAKEEAKLVEEAKKAEEQAKKDAAAALKAAEKARAEAEALAAQEKAEREIFRVENYTPEGNLSSKSIKRVVITFNHPLETKVIQGEPTDEPTFVPKVTPAFPAGRWSVGGEAENALVFEADDEVSWPLSTKYTVKIVAGSMGAKNRPLAQELLFHFTTPTLLLTHMFPERKAVDISPSAPIVLVFDQPIDAKLLLSGKHKQLVIREYSSSNEVEYERCEDVETLENLQKAHQAGDSYTKHIIEGHADCHWIALLPKSPLKPHTTYSINLASELTSLLGPVKSREPAIDSSFITRSPFIVSSIDFHREEKQIDIRFTWPLCGPKQDLSDISWRPTISPNPPDGIWVLDDARTQLTYLIDNCLRFEPSTEYIVTLASGLAKSFYDQPFEKNNNLSHWHTGKPLPQLNVDAGRHQPVEPLWWSFVTSTNTIVKMHPSDTYIRGSQIFMIETSQPLDEAKFVSNVHFYCNKSGIVAGLTSLVKKPKPFGACVMVPWDSLKDVSYLRWTYEQWGWQRTWSTLQNPRYYYAFKCTQDFLVDHDIELVIAPHLHSTFGPIPAVVESKKTFELYTPSQMQRPHWLVIDNRPKLAAECPAMQTLVDKVREAAPTLASVFTEVRTDLRDDFRPNASTPSGLHPVNPKENLREKAETALAAWQAKQDSLQQKQDTAVQAHLADMQAHQTEYDQHKQAVAAHAKASRDAIKAGQPLPPPVAPFVAKYLYPMPPTYFEAPKPGDLPMVTVDELITPWAPRHALVVPFSRILVDNARDGLNWTPVIQPAPPAGQWLINSKLNSFVFVPSEAWNLSTQYSVSVPANARCAWGVPVEDISKDEVCQVSSTIGQPEAFWWPAGNSSQLPVMPIFVVCFTQRVSPKKITDFIQFLVTHELGEKLKSPHRVKASIVPEDEWKKNEAITQQVGFYAPGKFIVVRPASALPYRSTIEISALAGVSFAEGPLESIVPKSLVFHTVPTFEVTSYAPESRPLTSTDPIFIRFNQPLVKVEASFVDGDYKLPWTPIITPAHPGKWSLQRDGRTLNPSSLKFTPSKPWKRATEYKVTIPAGTASLVGETLQKDFVGSSSTPVVELVRVWPSDGGWIARTPYIYLEFDSPVNDADVLAAALLHSKMHTDTNGSHGIPLAVVKEKDALLNATISKMVAECRSIRQPSEVDDDESLTQKPSTDKPKKSKSGDKKSTTPRHWAVLTPTKPLMYHDIVSLALVDLVSAEGTLKSKYSYKLKFNVVGPLEVQLTSPVAWRQELPSSEIRLAMEFNQSVSSRHSRIEASYHVQKLPSYTTTQEVSEYHNEAVAPSPIFEFMGSDGKPVGKPIKLQWVVEDGGKKLITKDSVSMLPSSHYRLTVPMPATSIYDEKLPEARVFNLHTPTNRVTECYPRPGGLVRDVSLMAPVLLRFTQPIDHAAVLPRLQFYVKKEAGKSMLSLFGKGKKDDKPYCGAVLMQPDELRFCDAKIKQIISEWAELDAKHAALSSGIADLAVSMASHAVPAEESAKKKKSKDKATKTEEEDIMARNEMKRKEFGSPYGTNYWILVRPERALPHDSNAKLVIGPQIPSLFGPGLAPERKMKLHFATAPILEVKANRYDGGEARAVIFKFNQNMFHDGTKLMDAKDLTWKPLLNVELPPSSYPTWWIVNSTTLKFWVRSWPKSTKYVFMLPTSGAVSMLGEQLQDRFTYEFEDPTVNIVSRIPNGGTTVCDPVFGLKFDQFVDAKEIAANCSIVLKNEKTPYCGMEPIRFADALASIKSVRLYGTSNSATASPEQLFAFREKSAGKVVWLRPKNPLPPKKQYRLVCGPGLPSLEGPLTTAKPVKFSYSSAPSFSLTEAKEVKVSRLEPFHILFNRAVADGLNAEDPSIKSRLLSSITVEPPVPVEHVECRSSYMRVWLRSDALIDTKTYKVTVADWITDSIGQSLAEHIEDPVANAAARTFKVTVSPIPVTQDLVADMGSYPTHPRNLMITYDPMMLYHAQAEGRKPTFRVQNVNFPSVRVVLYKLDPLHDLAHWVKLSDFTDKEPLPKGMGRLVSDSIVTIPELNDPLNYGSYVPLEIDLSAALENVDESLGHVGVVVMPNKAYRPKEICPIVRAWVQCTRMSVEVFPTATGFKAWVHDMIENVPLKAAKVSTIPGVPLDKTDIKKYIELSPGVTDKDGWATLDGGKSDFNPSRHMIVIKGADTCILQGVHLHSTRSTVMGPRVISHIWNDRGMYRPKENVEIKGYLREFRMLDDGTPSMTVPALAEGKEAQDDIKNLTWTLYDPTGAKVSDGTFVLSPTYGTFHITVALPESINLGECYVTFAGLGPLKIDSQPHLNDRLYLDVKHTFVVQEFRRPDFVAKSEILEQRPVYLYGEDALVKVEASYFAGGGLGECDVTWKVASTKASFNSPGWLGYLFTTAKDSLELAHSERLQRPVYDYTKSFNGMTDEKGRHAVKIAFKGQPDVCEPVQVVIDMEVLDLNKQALTSQQKLLVHPNRVYLGVKLPDGSNLMGDISSPGGPQGKPLQVMLVAADIDGKLVADLPIQIRVCKVLAANKDKLQETLETRLVASRTGVPAIFEFDRTKYTQSRLIEAFALIVTMKDPGTGRMSEVVVLLNDPVAVTANSPNAVAVVSPTISPTNPSIAPIAHYRGNYESFTMKDRNDPLTLTKYSLPPVDALEIEMIETEYKVGQQARLKVTTGLPLPAEAIVVVRGDLGHSVLSTQTMSLQDKVTIIEFPLTDANAPWTTVHVSAISSVVREGQEENAVVHYHRLAQAEGQLQLPVVSNVHELRLNVEPADPLAAPGTETEVTVHVVDADSNPVDKAEVALVVIDESVLSMTQHEIKNPVKVFYDPEPMRAYIPNIAQYSLRKGIQLKDMKAVLEETEQRKRAAIEIIEDDTELVVASSEEELNDDIEEIDDGLVDAQAEEMTDTDVDDEEPQQYYSLADEYEAREMMMLSGFGGGPPREVTKGARRKQSSKPSSNASTAHALSPSSSASRPPAPPLSPRQASAFGAASSSSPPPPPPGASSGPSMSAPPAPYPKLSQDLVMRRSSFADNDDAASESDDEGDWDEVVNAIQSEGQRVLAELKSDRLKLEACSEDLEMKKSAPMKMKKKSLAKDTKMKEKEPMNFARSRKSAAPAPMMMKERDKADKADRNYSQAQPASLLNDYEEERGSKLAEYAPMEMADEVGAFADEAEEAEEEVEELFLRSNFNPLAHFSDSVIVNDEGIAKILVKLPDNLTRYRIWAIAVSSKNSKFGMGESLITASLPLQVRITPPRFLNFNDDAELPIVIQNLRDKPIDVKVGIRSLRAILGATQPKEEDGSLASGSKPFNAFLSPDLTTTGFLVEIPANGRRLLTVPIKATKAGVCRFQVSVLQGLFGDAQEVSVTVNAPPTTNSFSFSGSLAGGKKPAAICTDLRVPSDALPGFGSLEVALSTTKMQSLSEPAVYLSNIPFEYAEQRASRVMALSALASLLEALSNSNKKARYPSAYQIKATIGSDMSWFKNMQASDGSFRMWGGGVAPPPPTPSMGPATADQGALTRAWLTAQVAQAVAAARAGGFNTHEPLVTLFSKSWTQKLEKVLVELCERPLYAKDSSFAAWAAAKCYTIYAYAKLSKDSKKAAKYAEIFYNATSPQTLSVESIGFLLTVFADAKHDLAAQLVNYLETAITTYDLETRVSYPDIYSDESRYELFHSRTRTDAVLLEAIVSAKPESKLVGHLFRGLMRNRVDGKWTNTQDNAFCVVALHRYFTVFEAVVPDLKARVWLDTDMCVEEAFQGRTTDTRITEIPMSYVLKNGAQADDAVLVDKAKKKHGAKDAESSDASAVVVEESADDHSGTGEDDDDVEDPRMIGNDSEPLQGKALMIHKAGKGRVYYTLKINYSPSTLKVPAADCGFAVNRHYASPTYIADLSAVTDLLYLREEATWRVKKGTKVRVELKLTVFFPTTFVALVDHLPAGFEPVSVDEHPTREKVLAPELPGSTTLIVQDQKQWWAHVNLRDSRVEVLADKLTPGTYHFAYVARATMAGHFNVPPARTQELYQPAVFGNTESTKVEIF